jgi:EAL and modified HD-GYP domain-containing signal transduction protein
MALERARFCEMIAPLINEAAPRLYLLGLISLLDTILSMPMSRVLAVLPIDNEMKAALMGIKIPLARALMLIRSYESGDWQQCAEIRDALGITEYVASMIYFESMQWANKVLTL